MDIQTVTGPIQAEQLGVTLMHEHIFNASPGIWETIPEVFGSREDFVQKATDVVTAARVQANVSTVVDLTPYDLGRSAEVLRDVSERSGVHVVAATGHHNQFNVTTRVMNANDFARF